MSLISVSIAALVLGGGHPPQMAKLVYSKTLPASTKPMLSPALLKGKSLVSAGEYQIEKEAVRRVFRYSFKGDVVAFSSAAAKQKGWTSEVIKDSAGKEQPSQGSMLTSPELHGAVIRQYVTVLPGQYVVDAKSRFGSKKVMMKGWISVSYNEEYAGKPKGQ